MTGGRAGGRGGGQAAQLRALSAARDQLAAEVVAGRGAVATMREALGNAEDSVRRLLRADGR